MRSPSAEGQLGHPKRPRFIADDGALTHAYIQLIPALPSDYLANRQAAHSAAAWAFGVRGTAMTSAPAWLDSATTEPGVGSGIVTRALGTGERFGRYRLVQQIGAGAMGSVYEAYDPLLDRSVAIKVPISGTAAARLRAEAKALARIVHPNVIAVHDVSDLSEQTFVVLELAEGMTLRDWLAVERRNVRAVVDVVVAAGRGLAAAHAAGLLHRDFKPENVIVGHDRRVRVLDFGIASDFNDDAVGAGRVVVGTPAYMAPEQRAGTAVSTLADQFSFCVVLWEALFEERPYRNDEFLKLMRGDRRVRPSVPPTEHAVPAWLQRLLERGLRVEAMARHASMTVLLDAIELGLGNLD